MKRPALPIQGTGVSVRSEFINDLLSEQDHHVQPDWLEILVDNYLTEGGLHLQRLEQLCARFDTVFHSTNINLGSMDVLNTNYIRKIATAVDRYRPAWVSDHLAFVGINGKNIPDLLPLPFHSAMIDHIVPRIKQTIDILSRPFLIENISYYICYQDQNMPEAEFLGEIAEQSGCSILLDINNLYINSRNFGYCPRTFIQTLPSSKVMQIHIAGHHDSGKFLVDTHGSAASPEVLELLEYALTVFPGTPVCYERDANIPPYAEIAQELQTLKGLHP